MNLKGSALRFHSPFLFCFCFVILTSVVAINSNKAKLSLLAANQQQSDGGSGGGGGGGVGSRMSLSLSREELLRPLSTYPWTEAPRVRPSSLKKNNSNGSAEGGDSSSSSKTVTTSSVLLTPAQQFNAQALAVSAAVVEAAEDRADEVTAASLAAARSTAAAAATREATRTDTTTTTPTQLPSLGMTGKLVSTSSSTYKVTGCASPELGAHVLVKLMNRSGYELGSAVVSLTHLLHKNTDEVHATQFNNVRFVETAVFFLLALCLTCFFMPFSPLTYRCVNYFVLLLATLQITITSGGQQRGCISGKFSLRFLPSLIASAAADVPTSPLAPTTTTSESIASTSHLSV
jgi:hypothetical protein